VRRCSFYVLDTPNDALCGNSSGRVLLCTDGNDRYAVSPSDVSLSAIDDIPSTRKTLRLLDGQLKSRLFRSVLSIARRHRLLSDEYFSVDGTLIDAWVSHKSFRPRDDGSNTSGDTVSHVDSTRIMLTLIYGPSWL
jgi:hypothetical protein